jgi:uncharacterized protein involved in exopolysaccharide biosynthesis
MPYYTLGDLLRDCWRARYVLLVCGAVMLGGAIAWCSLVTPHYAITMTVGPSDKASARAVADPGKTSRLSAVQYVAEQAGLMREHDDYARYKAILTGHQVAERLNTHNPEQARQLVRYAAWPWQAVDDDVTAARVSAALDSVITSRPTGRGQMRKIRMHHPDPVYAKSLLARLHKAGDSILRQREDAKVDQRITYLRQKLADTEHPDHRDVLTSLLMRQERTKMMISMDQAYAANIIARPSATPGPVWPLPGIIIPVAVLIGIILGYLGFMVYKVITARRPANTQNPEGDRARPAPVTEIRAYSANE